MWVSVQTVSFPEEETLMPYPPLTITLTYKISSSVFIELNQTKPSPKEKLNGPYVHHAEMYLRLL